MAGKESCSRGERDRVIGCVLMRTETATRGVPIFYGWWVLAASVVIELFGIGFGIFAITTTYPYIIETFPDWSRSTIFLPTSIIILTVGVLSPLVGALIDRFPIRIVFATGALVQGVALFAFTRVQTPLQYMVVSIFIGVGLAGVTILPNQVLISRWFHARVGLVNGILLGATAFGAALSPALITRLIEASDWRSALSWMALVAAVPPLLVTWLVVRDRPEDLGLQPYGSADAESSGGLIPAASTAGIPVREALRSRTFWALAAVIFLGGMPCYSHNKHILVFLRELGLDAVSAADYKSFLFLVAAVSRIIFGWLADRVDRRRLTIMTIVLIGVGYPILLLVPRDPDLLVVSLLLFGAGYGGLLPAIPILSVHYFGRRDLGKILGAYKIIYDVAAASAPLLTAVLYDRTGGYAVPQALLTGFAWVAIAIAVLWLPRGGMLSLEARAHR